MTTNPAKTLIIAEAGVNHNGELSVAKELIDAAAQAKADVVKFQSFSTDKVVSKYALKAEYQIRNTGQGKTQHEMLKGLELSLESFVQLYDYAKSKGIAFLSTAFDSDSLAFLIKQCALQTLKVPSGEITNAPYLFAIGRQRLPIILSTGMSNEREIETALAILAYGSMHAAPPASVKDCLTFYQSAEGAQCLQEKVTILHCVTEYPAPYCETNLKAMHTLRDRFGFPVGLSDHSLGTHIPIAAVAMGACVIEKHFTLNKRMDGPDHAASLEPDALACMVASIRDVEMAMGDGKKQVQPCEKANLPIARRSLVASQPIKKGERLSEQNVSCKRPGNGMSAEYYWDYIGQPAMQAYDPDELLRE
jgi:N-acetylneuraminate synthase